MQEIKEGASATQYLYCSYRTPEKPFKTLNIVILWKAWEEMASLSDNFYTCLYGTLNVPEVGSELTLGGRST